MTKEVVGDLSEIRGESFQPRPLQQETFLACIVGPGPKL